MYHHPYKHFEWVKILPLCVYRGIRDNGDGRRMEISTFFWLFLLLQKHSLSQGDQPSLFVWNCSDFNNESLAPWEVPQSQANLKVQHPRFSSNVTLHSSCKHNPFFHGTTQSNMAYISTAWVKLWKFWKSSHLMKYSPFQVYKTKFASGFSPVSLENWQAVYDFSDFMYT